MRCFYGAIFFQNLLTNPKKIAYNNIAGRNALYTRVTEFTLKRHLMSSVVGPPLGKIKYSFKAFRSPVVGGLGAFFMPK